MDIDAFILQNINSPMVPYRLVVEYAPQSPILTDKLEDKTLNPEPSTRNRFYEGSQRTPSQADITDLSTTREPLYTLSPKPKNKTQNPKPRHAKNLHPVKPGSCLRQGSAVRGPSPAKCAVAVARRDKARGPLLAYRELSELGSLLGSFLFYWCHILLGIQTGTLI